MTTIPLSESLDHTPAPEAEVRIDPIGHRALVIDRAVPFDYATHFGSASLGAIALKLKKKSVHYLRRNFDFILKFGAQADEFRTSCCQFSGGEQGTIDFNSWLSQEGEPGHVTKAALKIYEFYNSLPRVWQLFIITYVENWSFSALTLLAELNLKVLDVFFWGAEGIRKHRKHRKKKETKEALSILVSASKGVRKVYNNQPLEIADWVYIFAVTSVERERFDEVYSLATQIATSFEREVWLDDAIAALKEFGYNTSAISVVKEKTPPTQKKVYTESDLEKARLEAVAKYEEDLAIARAELAVKNAQLEQLNQQLQSAATSTELLAQKEAEITEQKAQIEWLRKLLDEARQEKTPSPSTISSLRKDLGVVPQTPNLSLKIDDFSVIPSTDPIATILRDSTPPPIDIASYQKSAVYQNDWDSKKYQLSLVTARNEQTALTSRQNNARSSTFSVKKGFGRG
jgi:hypothetical protein